MDITKFFLSLLLLVLSAIIVTGEIYCYTCWSKDNVECEAENLEGTNRQLQKCGPKENVCKKIVTESYRVIKRGNEARYQIISNLTSRLCGQADWRGCFSMDGASSRTVQCACDTDHCNSASTSHISMATALLATSLALFLTSSYLQ